MCCRHCCRCYVVNESTWNSLFCCEWKYVEFLGMSDSLFSSGRPHSKWVSCYLVRVEGPGVIQAGTTGKWNNVAMPVPPTVPSRLAGCGIINVNYVLKVRQSFMSFVLLVQVHFRCASRGLVICIPTIIMFILQHQTQKLYLLQRFVRQWRTSWGIWSHDVAIRYSLCVWLCNMDVIVVNLTWWTFTNNLQSSFYFVYCSFVVSIVWTEKTLCIIA